MNNQYCTLLEIRYRELRPYWFPTAWKRCAETLWNSLDPQLKACLTDWLDTGKEVDFHFEKYALSDLMAIAGTDYLGAVELMNQYIANPVGFDSILFQV